MDDRPERRGVSGGCPDARRVLKALKLTDLKPPTPPEGEETGCDPKMGLRCISLRLLTCGYVRHLLVVRIAQNAVDFLVFKGVGSQILGDRRLA